MAPTGEAPGGRVLIGLMGDVMLGRLVDEAIPTVGYAYPWGNLLGVLRSTDLNLANLETTLTTSSDPAVKIFTFKAAPDRVQVLSEARIDVCNLANNHILDYHGPGLVETLEVLDVAGIRHVGAGRTAAEAAAPVVVERRGVTVGIVGYTDNEPGWTAGDGRPGTRFIDVNDIPCVQSDVRALKERVDLVIVTIHWGPNMRLKPTPGFRRFAHAAIDAGADVLHGHSAHVFQGIEAYSRGLILYDTGDFVDDYAVDPRLRNDLSFLYLVQADGAGVAALELIPVRIANLQVNRAEGDDYRLAVDRIAALSAEFGTEVVEAEPGLLRVPLAVRER